MVLLGASLGVSKTVVTRYRIFLEQAHYASSTINLRLAAVRRHAYEAAEQGRRVLDVFDRQTLRGTRDYAMAAVLLGTSRRGQTERYPVLLWLTP